MTADNPGKPNYGKQALGFLKAHRLAASIVASGLVAVLIYIFFSVKQSVHNTGVGLQRDVVTAEKQMEVSLSQCLDSGRIANQVAQEQYNAVKDILTSVVSARYVDKDGKSTVASGTLGGGALISSLHEQYPSVDVSTWTKLMDIVVSCRKDFADKQDQVQSLAANFDKWTQQGGVFTSSWHSEFPTHALSAYDAQKHQTVYGREALDWYTRVIKTADAQKAIDTGIMPDQNLTPSGVPSK